MKTAKEISLLLVCLTVDYTDLYFKNFKRDMDKQLWAALQLGFIAGMKVNGYKERVLNMAMELAEVELKAIEKEVNESK